jgi:hypothetical protein
MRANGACRSISFAELDEVCTSTGTSRMQKEFRNHVLNSILPLQEQHKAIFLWEQYYPYGFGPDDTSWASTKPATIWQLSTQTIVASMNTHFDH